MNSQTIGALAGVAIAATIILLRNRKPRPLRLRWLWVRPLVLLLAAAAIIAVAPPRLTPAAVSVLVLSAGLGGALGWWRGRFTRISVNPAKREVTAQSSPAGIAFILAVLVLRTLMRSSLAGASKVFDVGADAITAGLLLLAVGMVAIQAIEIWLRARRTLAETPPAADTASFADPNGEGCATPGR